MTGLSIGQRQPEDQRRARMVADRGRPLTVQGLVDVFQQAMSTVLRDEAQAQP